MCAHLLFGKDHSYQSKPLLQLKIGKIANPSQPNSKIRRRFVAGLRLYLTCSKCPNGFWDTVRRRDTERREQT
jgi:hypothetical protein